MTFFRWKYIKQHRRGRVQVIGRSFSRIFAFFTRMPPHLADVLKWLYGRYKDTLQVLVRIFADFAEKIGFGLEDSANQSVFGHFASWVLPPCLLGSNAISGDFQSPSSPDYAD